MPPVDRALLDEKVEEIFEKVVTWRRHIHANPDLSFHEKATADYIAHELEQLDPEQKHLKVRRPLPNAVIADLHGTAGNGPIIALRADIDALPIHELSGETFASTKKDVMHACGHDTHTSMLMGAAALLVCEVHRIRGTVRFLFQHAEETVPGGARDLIAAGCMEGVSMIFGEHIFSFPYTPTGSAMVRRGPITSSSDSVTIEIIGHGGHASMPELTVDPIAVACTAVTALQQVVSRKMPACKAPVFTVASIRSSSESFNVISDKVTLMGTLRTQDETVRTDARRCVEEILKGVTSGFGATYTCTWHDGYAITFNSDEAVDVSLRVLEQVLPRAEDVVFLENCLMGAEDFSAYSKLVPGNFIGIGTYNEKLGCTGSLHTAKFKVDENALKVGIKIHYGHIHELLM